MTETQTQTDHGGPDSPEIDYAEGVPPEVLARTVTTDVEELWQENEQLFVYMLSRANTNWLLRTVPGGGKSYVKETVVPQLAYTTNRRFVLATTEYRNRQETYRNIQKTLRERNLADHVDVVYIPSPREVYQEIRHCERPGEHARSGPEAVCQTFTADDEGEYIHDVANGIDRLVSRGTTTRAIHSAALNEWERIKWPQEIDHRDGPLPCQRIGVEQGYDPNDPESAPACRHQRIMRQRMEQIRNGNADIIICGAALLNISEVVEDATIIADEDVSRELVKQYPETYLKTASEAFLSSLDIGPDGYLGAHRASVDVKAKVADHIRENYAPQSELSEHDNRDPLVNPNAPIKTQSIPYARAEAPLLGLALMEGEQTDHTNHLVFDSDDIPYTVTIDLTANNVNNNHDPLAIARPPHPLQAAEQMIALDATGDEEWWELFTDLEFQPTSPNRRDTQGQVVYEAFDIEFRQLTEEMVAINRPNNMTSRKFLGILQAIVDHHDADEVSVVTSKAMKRKVKNSEYADEIMDLAYRDTILHFGGLRSDRTFESSRLHVVIGAPHPGDDAVRQRMALLGHDDKIVQDNYAIRGENRYKGEALTVLENMVYSEVYQAARRAARDAERDETAYVYIFTRMFDEDLIQVDDKYSVEIYGSEEQRQGGTEAILTVLDLSDQALGTDQIVGRVNDRLDDSLSSRQILSKLNELADAGLVEKLAWIGRSKRWAMTGSPRHGTLIENTV